MKIAVLNFSGNVGKTTIVHNLLAPRLPASEIIAIETINDDGGVQFKIKGSEYSLLQDELLISDDLIIDIGASNVEETLKMMKQYKGSHEDFDYFILPTVPDTKQQTDTVSTISALLDIKIPVKKIRLVFNMVNNVDLQDFATIHNFANTLKIPVPKAGIEYNEVYQNLQQQKGSSICDLLELEKNSIDEVVNINNIITLQGLRKKVRETKDDTAKRQIASLVGLQRLAVTANENLDEVFNELKLT